ncbi:CSC1-like protein At3g54510 isoform X2 [Malania oleifera]|uniref:CSC1-like protein At3g54510 isoform X2 n=1 Tax=Malania oleifera TaxID=397392 RepID=UPI0025AEA395|nr:CSC1-like protein At3g54510 isoform X2 [Malania oleifera]
MKTESLLASAAINIGMSMVILSLFSILKKQPSTAPIYYARLLSHRLRLPPFQPPSLLRFLPSVSWIPRAFRVSEDEIIATSGLDALVIIRLFKFGINFFTVCSAVGLLVLLPVNYLEGAPASSSSNCMDSFTISNISRGSNRLWVHYSCLCFISLYALYLLYKEYSEILEKRIQQLRNCRHQPDQFAILVREIPFCVEHQAQGCSVDHFFSKHHPYSYQSYQILYEGNYIENLLAKSIARKIEDLRHRSMCKKRKKIFLFFGAFQEYAAEISQLEERLQEFYRKIRIAQCENILTHQELPVAFVTFNSRWGTALAAQSQQHSNPLLFITEMAPEPRDVIWRNLEIPYRHLPLYKIAVFLATLILTVFFAIPVTAVQGIAKFEKLRKWFPPAMAVQLIPGLRSIVTGYLPSVILNGFIYTIPFAMLALSNLAGCISTSNRDIKACNMVFYFLMGNVFFLSLLSGSLLEEIGESVSHPRNIPSHLARAVSAQADFFMTYILADGLSGFSLEVLQPTLLLWDLIKTYTYGYGKKKNPYLYMLPYFRVIPFVSLSILIGMIYAVVSPLLLPFLVGYFFLGYAVYVNQIQDVYETVYETCGQYWPCIHHYILIAIILMQITMIGLFGLKSKPAASISTVPLLLFTLMFNEYCKIRFLPTFSQYSIQKAVENDELDKKGGLMEINYENALNAYRPPCLTPVNLLASESSSESSSTQPLVSSL